MNDMAIQIILTVAPLLLAFSFGYGTLWRGNREVIRRLDRLNGKVDLHEGRLNNQGERLASLEGRRQQ